MLYVFAFSVVFLINNIVVREYFFNVIRTQEQLGIYKLMNKDQIQDIMKLVFYLL